MKVLRPCWLLGVLLLGAPAAAQSPEADEADVAAEPAQPDAEADLALPAIPPAAAPTPPTLSQEEELLQEVFAIVEDDYYDASVTRGELVEAAVRGMLEYLNTRSEQRLRMPGRNALLSPNEYTRLRDTLSGQISGIGVVARRHATNGNLEIVRVIDNSPGKQAGLHPGDQIVTVDNMQINQVGAAAAEFMLRGAPGTKVRIGVQQAGHMEPSEVQIVRGSFRVPRLTSNLVNDCTGYLRVSTFAPGVSENAAEALAQFAADGIHALVLDLRDNPGGSLEEAVGLANLLIDKKGEPVVMLSTRTGPNQAAFTTGDALFSDPVVVLVDNNTAGAAEVLAAALQAHQRGLLVGSRTAGRATAESIFGLSTGAALRISTAMYYDPKGKTWAGAGLTPLVDVEPLPFGPGDPVDPALQRAEKLLRNIKPCEAPVRTIRAQ